MQISEIVTASRILLTPITPCSGLHHLVFLFPTLPFSTYSVQFLLTQHQIMLFFSGTLYCLHSETLPLLITAAFLLIDQLPAAHANRDTSGLHRPHLLKTGFHATSCLILTTSVAVSGHNPIIFCRNWEGASEEKRCTPCVICDEKLRATSYHFRRKSVTLRHRLSLPEKPLNDSTDLLVIKRQVWPLPLPPPSNTQLANNQSNVHSSRVGNPALYILNSTCLTVLLVHARGDSVVRQQKLQSESNFHPCRYLSLIHFLIQVRNKHFVQSH